MATLLIQDETLAGWIESDLEGRLEVMADDGLEEQPDYIDADALANAIRAITAFPATITLSDAEAVQAAISIENYMDFADPDESFESAKAAHSHLEAQGYFKTDDDTVLAYFSRKLKLPADDNEAVAMAGMPLVSNCGDDCKKAIDNAAAFIASIRKAYGNYRPELIDNTINATADVVCCFICG